jgi:hypothetical protein
MLIIRRSAISVLTFDLPDARALLLLIWLHTRRREKEFVFFIMLMIYDFTRHVFVRRV